MALVRLSDAIVPDIFTSYMTFDTLTKADVFQSGIVKQDAAMAALLSGGGRLFQHPVWGDLDSAEAPIGSDNPATVIVPKKIGSFKHQFVRQFRTQAWSSADLVAELAGSDPMKRISERVSAYWARQFDRTTIATINGIMNANIAQNSGDMVLDISARTGTVLVGNTTVNAYSLYAGAILEAKQTMGDKADSLRLIVMHSVIYTKLQNQNLIQFIPNSQGVINIPTYLNYRVLVTDNVPVTVSGPDLIYTTYLVGEGVIGFTEKPPAVPVETFRNPEQGNGTGVESLYTRRQYALHPYGFNWADLTIAATFPTNTEIETANNWARVFPERKAINIALIKSKNG